MAARGAQPGNKNGARPFAAALKHAIADAGTDRAALIEIAKALLAKAMDGDLAAIREVADRLDGKPAQSTELTINDRRSAAELTNDELADIAAGRGEGVAESPAGAGEPAAVH